MCGTFSESIQVGSCKICNLRASGLAHNRLDHFYSQIDLSLVIRELTLLCDTFSASIQVGSCKACNLRVSGLAHNRLDHFLQTA
jgi:hypothetical protein